MTAHQQHRGDRVNALHIKPPAQPLKPRTLLSDVGDLLDWLHDRWGLLALLVAILTSGYLVVKSEAWWQATLRCL